MNTGTQVRVGGDVIGLSGNLNENNATTDLGFDSSGLLSIKSNGSCNGNSSTLCLQGTANGGTNVSSLFLVLTNAETSSGISIDTLHIIGAVCGNEQTCHAEGVPVTTIPEPGTLGLLGTGLVGIAGLVRRRFAK